MSPQTLSLSLSQSVTELYLFCFVTHSKVHVRLYVYSLKRFRNISIFECHRVFMTISAHYDTLTEPKKNEIGTLIFKQILSFYKKTTRISNCFWSVLTKV